MSPLRTVEIFPSIYLRPFHDTSFTQTFKAFKFIHHPRGPFYHVMGPFYPCSPLLGGRGRGGEGGLRRLWCTMLMRASEVKAEHLYSALHGRQTTLKRSGMDHTVLPAINTMPAFTS